MSKNKIKVWSETLYSYKIHYQYIIIQIWKECDAIVLKTQRIFILIIVIFTISISILNVKAAVLTYKTYVDQGKPLISQAKYNESLPVFDKAIALNQKYVSAYYYKGKALLFMKKYNDASITDATATHL